MTDKQSNATIKRDGLHWGEVAGLVALAGLTLLFLAFSWRKWPDPLIDFGRELYTPWRLANGAVLYRDVELFLRSVLRIFQCTNFHPLRAGPDGFGRGEPHRVRDYRDNTLSTLSSRLGNYFGIGGMRGLHCSLWIFTVCQHQQLQLRHTVFARGYARPVALFASDLRPFGIAETCDAASQFPRWNTSWPHGLIKTGNLVRRRCRYDRCSH